MIINLNFKSNIQKQINIHYYLGSGKKLKKIAEK